MKTALIVGGVIGLGALFWYFSRRPGAGTAPVSRIPPPTAITRQQQFQNNVADYSAHVLTTIVPGGGTIAQPLQSAARSYINGTVTGFTQAGTGLKQIASGNVISGAENVGLGAAETAYTATGAKGVVDFVKSLW